MVRRYKLDGLPLKDIYEVYEVTINIIPNLQYGWNCNSSFLIMYKLSLTEHRPEITSKVPMWEGSSKYFLLEKNLWVCNSAWLEYLSDTQEVGGSSPSAPTNGTVE